MTVKLRECVPDELPELDAELVLVVENVPLAVMLPDPDQLAEALPVPVRVEVLLRLPEQVGEEVAETVSLRDPVQLRVPDLLHVPEAVLLGVGEKLAEPVRVDDMDSDIVCEEVSDMLQLVVSEAEMLRLLLKLGEMLEEDVRLEDSELEHVVLALTVGDTLIDSDTEEETDLVTEYVGEKLEVKLLSLIHI